MVIISILINDIAKYISIYNEKEHSYSSISFVILI